MTRRLPGLIVLAHLLLLQMLAPFAHCHGEPQDRPHVHLDSLPFVGHDHPQPDEQPDPDHDEDAVYLPDDPTSLCRSDRFVADDSSSWVLPPGLQLLSLAPNAEPAPGPLPPPFIESLGPPVYLLACTLLI